jgi:DNA-binding transcriptional MerR regulator
MTIGELARAAGVRISTLRFYERRGMVRASTRSRAGYRCYVDADVDRVRFVKRGQELGFTLAELAALLALTSAAPLSRNDVARVGAMKLAEIDARIADLRRMRGAVQGLLDAPCIDLTAPCPIIAALARPPIAPFAISSSRPRRSKGAKV